MGLYNFDLQFVPMILDGTKRQTIRTVRRWPDRPGKVMHLYHGCIVLSPAIHLGNFECESVRSIALDVPARRVELAGVRLSADEAAALAWRDGFRPLGSTADAPGHSFRLMAAYWAGSKRLCREASLYTWRYDRAAVGNFQKLRPFIPLGLGRLRAKSFDNWLQRRGVAA
jgi:hypothetical protein